MHDIAQKSPAAGATAGPGGRLKAAPQSNFAPPRLQASNSWHKTKPIGDEAERRLAEHFQRQGFTVLQTLGRADFDLEISKRVEVKADGLAEQTGRVAVEISHDGEPSGLYASSAQLWAFVVGSEAFIIDVSTIRRVVQAGNYREVSAGDGGRSRCVLLPVAELRQLPGVKPIRLNSAPVSVAG